MTAGPDDPRWEYKIIWRYGPLLLLLVGLAMIGFGAAGLAAAAIRVTLLALGFVCLVAGVVLPRIEGKFTAGPSGLSGEMARITELDRRPSFSVTAPAVADDQPVADERQPELPAFARRWLHERITLGDVWDAIDAAGLRPEGVAGGSAFFNLADGRRLRMPNRGFQDHGTASDDLLAELAAWGIRPVASGKYPVPAGGGWLGPVPPSYLPPPQADLPPPQADGS